MCVCLCSAFLLPALSILLLHIRDARYYAPSRRLSSLANHQLLTRGAGLSLNCAAISGQCDATFIYLQRQGNRIQKRPPLLFSILSTRLLGCSLRDTDCFPFFFFFFFSFSLWRLSSWFPSFARFSSIYHAGPVQRCHSFHRSFLTSFLLPGYHIHRPNPQMPRGGRPPRITRRRRSGTSGRASRTTTRTTTTSSTGRTAGTTTTSLRRSSRIAEQLSRAHHLRDQPETTGSMADVARRTETRSGRQPHSTVDAELARRRSRQRSRRARFASVDPSPTPRARRPLSQTTTTTSAARYSSPVSEDDEQPGYAMDVMIQPPSSARPGRSLSPVVTVRLRRSTTSSSSSSGGADEGGDDAAAHLLAVATLVAENADRTPEQLQNALGGRRFDSVHSFTPELPESRGFGYVSFPDLVIRDEGLYRIRITLIKVRNNAASSSTSSSSSSPPDGGSNVYAVETNPIAVGPAHDSSGKLALGGPLRSLNALKLSFSVGDERRRPPTTAST